MKRRVDIKAPAALVVSEAIVISRLLASCPRDATQIHECVGRAWAKGVAPVEGGKRVDENGFRSECRVLFLFLFCVCALCGMSFIGFEY